MDHAADLAFVFGFYRDAVTAVAHGDDRILQIGAVGVYQTVQLGVNSVTGQPHGAPDLSELRAGVVADLLF